MAPRTYDNTLSMREKRVSTVTVTTIGEFMTYHCSTEYEQKLRVTYQRYMNLISRFNKVFSKFGECRPYALF